MVDPSPRESVVQSRHTLGVNPLPPDDDRVAPVAKAQPLMDELVAEHAMELVVDLEAELRLRSTPIKPYPWFVVDSFVQRNRAAENGR